jgi:hypothetical protein
MRPASWLGFALAVWGCEGEADRPPPLETEPSDAGANEDGEGGLDLDAGGDPDDCLAIPDAGLTCETEVIPIERERLNLYFLLDRSGSMSEPFEGGRSSKYQVAVGAIVEVLRTIGHRVHYGVTVAPEVTAAPGCGPGTELFPTIAGDTVCYGHAGEDGPVLSSLRARLGAVPPQGITPIGASLEVLAETLPALEGDTALVLATDGAPNCNDSLSCDAATCIANIEGLSLETTSGIVACDDDFNCCDPVLTELPGARTNCIDSARPEAAIEELAEAGVPTYVVGLPGSEPYRDVLDGFAEAGMTAREGAIAYYPAADSEALTEALLAIGLAVSVDCEFTLSSGPPDPDLVNVYFDGEAVPLDDEDGWQWASDDTISIVGDACDRLQSGSVFSVQVLAGCPVVVR